jgi:hypothetical protein
MIYRSRSLLPCIHLYSGPTLVHIYQATIPLIPINSDNLLTTWRWDPNYIPAHTCHNSIPAHKCHNSIPVWLHPTRNLTRSLYRVHTQSPLGGGVGSGLYIFGKDSSVFQSKGNSKVGTRAQHFPSNLYSYPHHNHQHWLMPTHSMTCVHPCPSIAWH